MVEHDRGSLSDDDRASSAPGDQPGSAFSAALSRAIDRRGVALSELRDRLAAQGCRVGLTTLSYWRSGQRHPAGEASLAAVAALEELLQLAPGQLSSLVESPVRSRPGPAPVPHEAVLAHAPSLLAVLGLVGLSGERDPLQRSMHLMLDVDHAGVERRLQIRTVMRALVPDTDGFVYAFGLDEPLPGAVRFQAGTGCRLEDTVLSPGGDAVAATFRFDRPLRAGETALVEHEVFFEEDWLPQCHYEHSFRRRVGELVMQVRFHPDRVPDYCESYAADREGERRARLDLSGRTAAHLVLRDQSPGTVGMTWGWQGGPPGW